MAELSEIAKLKLEVAWHQEREVELWLALRDLYRHVKGLYYERWVPDSMVLIDADMCYRVEELIERYE